jgi:glycosyltransferase involved in cell wall biosynthesis
MTAIDLSLVLPCYDEAAHLRRSVAEIVDVLEQTRSSWEIVFVDDVSRDDTRAVIGELCAADPRLRAVFHERNRGRGAAFKTGFRAASGRTTGFIDVDLEVHARYTQLVARRTRRRRRDRPALLQPATDGRAPSRPAVVGLPPPMRGTAERRRA